MLEVLACKQISFYSCGPCRFQTVGLSPMRMLRLTSTGKRSNKIDNHAWSRLASMACSTIPRYQRLGVIRAVFECIDVASNLGQIVYHHLMKCFDVSFLVEAPGYARLVCNDEYKVTSIVGDLYRFARAINPPQLTDLKHILGILVQYSIPIEKPAGLFISHLKTTECCPAGTVWSETTTF